MLAFCIECLQIKDKARKERIFKINQILMTKTKKIVKIIEISNLFMKCKIANKTKYDEKLLAFEIDQFHQIENFEVNDFYLTE